MMKVGETYIVKQDDDNNSYLLKVIKLSRGRIYCDYQTIDSKNKDIKRDYFVIDELVYLAKTDKEFVDYTFEDLCVGDTFYIDKSEILFTKISSSNLGSGYSVSLSSYHLFRDNSNHVYCERYNFIIIKEKDKK